MSKIEELKNTYMKDVEVAASKSKFGFFSIPPSVSAGNTAFPQKTSIIFSLSKTYSHQKLKWKSTNITKEHIFRCIS